MSSESINILNNFFRHAEKINLELLEGDKRYLRCLAMAAKPDRLRNALIAYIDHWQKAMQNELNENKKQGEGRRAANNYIRDAI